ncbi:hypothetical protein TNIN_391801 [Trichonephila inaurata madagascariensis]|uniref:Uncharacterized protein n=1 Tax=Trichonephila inaurata madagascariensis TaxID=2747483 RepID=A0A8X7CSA9_9ARAC|nr:hypothetical protein TNIN_391801 [Trichonephila inaurata madagascariensis]
MEQQDYETTDMDSPRRTPTPPLLSADSTEQSPAAKEMETFKKFKLTCISELKAMPDHHPDETVSEIEETINLGISDIASFPHESVSKINTPKNSPYVTPTKRILSFNNNKTSNKRKEDSDFASKEANSETNFKPSD